MPSLAEAAELHELFAHLAGGVEIAAATRGVDPAPQHVARFGDEGARLHARARGEETERFRPRKTPERMALGLPLDRVSVKAKSNEGLDAVGQREAVAVHAVALLEELKADAERHGHSTEIHVSGDHTAQVRADAFKRCLSNLVSNACRYGNRIDISAVRDARFLTINVDDDGPGIPVERREDVFRPFYRLDESRNQDEGNTGLGLAIARDIARSHGGDIDLGQSPLGG